MFFYKADIEKFKLSGCIEISAFNESNLRSSSYPSLQTLIELISEDDVFDQWCNEENS